MNRRSIAWALVAAVLAVGLGLALRSPRDVSRAVPVENAPRESASPAPLAALEVTVRSAGQALGGAKVGLALGDDLVASGYTDDRGALLLGQLEPGRLRLIVSHARCLRHEQHVELGAGTRRVEIDMPVAAVLRVRVEDGEGQPLDAATVRVASMDEREKGRCETGATGVCEVGELEPGTFVVHAHTGRHRPRRAEVRLGVAGAVVDQTIRLDAGRTLSGRVVDDTGVVVEGARVGSSDDGGAIATTDESGRFDLRGLGDSPINVFATAAGFAPSHLRALRPGSANVEIRLQKPASVDASLAFAGETKSALVSVCEYDTHFSKEVCVARRLYEPPEREILLEGLPAGTYDVVVEASGHQTERVRVHLESNRRASLGEVRLRVQK